MKNNNVFTYALVALLIIIIAVLGYRACQSSKESAQKKAKEEAELQQTLRNMNYGGSDTAATTGSSFAGEDTSHTAKTTTPVTDKTGAAKQPETTAQTTPKTVAAPPQTTHSLNTSSKTSTGASKTTLAPKTGTTTTAKTVAAPKVKGPGTGRWTVRAGTFAYMDGARRRLEEVIKAGYPNAEISKTSTGKAAVVVLRSNDKNAAIRVVDQLENKGIDAAVFDRNH